MDTKALHKSHPVGAGPFKENHKRRARQFRITRQGWYYLAMTLGTGFAALRTGNNLLFLVLGMMLGMIILSGVMAELALWKLELERYPPNRMSSCRPFLMKVSVKNQKKKLPSFSIEVEDILEGQLMDKRCFFLKIPAGRIQTTSYRHAFPRRGKYRFLGFKVSTKFPFGLLRKSIFVEKNEDVIVFPSPKKVEVPLKTMSGMTGRRSRQRRQRQGDPFGLREYRPGDDPRQIHHKASAHLNRPVVREYEDTSANRAVIYLDNGLNLEKLEEEESYLSASEAFELAVGRTAYLAEHFSKLGVELSIVTRSGFVPFGQGRHHQAGVLRFLSLLPYEDGDTPLKTHHHQPSDLAILVGRRGIKAMNPGLSSAFGETMGNGTSGIASLEGMESMEGIAP